jgi:putative phosphoesterase
MEVPEKEGAVNNKPTRVGLISDTHGLLRAEVHEALQGVDLILHAGDVGTNMVLDELRTIAPVRAVLGNTDSPKELELEYALDLELAGVRVHVSHGHELGSPDPKKLLGAYDADVIVFGHTHRQLLHQESGRIVVNPGAAGARRFDLPACVAVLTLGDGDPRVNFAVLCE